MSTNLTKWDDTGNELTAFCSDDTGDTEIGPAKWDDTNNKLEINCDATDFQVKWNDSTNKLEAQNVNDACCPTTIANCCDEASIDVTFGSGEDGITNCTEQFTFCLDELNGKTFTLPYSGAGGGYCDWQYDVGVVVASDHLFVYVTINQETGAIKVWAAVQESHACFGDSDTLASCDDFPINLTNDYVPEDCGDTDYLYAGGGRVRGHGGSAVVDWT